MPKKDVKGGTVIPNAPLSDIPTSNQRVIMINTNTYVSVGLLLFLAGALWAILSSISGTKTEITNLGLNMNSRFDKIETRVSSLESARNTWTSTDMFKWAVHLQQANPQIKVPEPEVNTK